MNNVRQILENVKNGDLSVEDAVLKLKTSPFEDIGAYNANVQKVKVVGKDGVVSKVYVCARCLKSNAVERA